LSKLLGLGFIPLQIHQPDADNHEPLQIHLLVPHPERLLFYKELGWEAGFRQHRTHPQEKPEGKLSYSTKIALFALTRTGLDTECALGVIVVVVMIVGSRWINVLCVDIIRIKIYIIKSYLKKT
jgi:hypothetical protein